MMDSGGESTEQDRERRVQALHELAHASDTVTPVT